MDSCSFDFNELNEEVLKRYPSHNDLVFSIIFVDKYVKEQSFIELNSDKSFTIMLDMYEKEKEITIYVTTNKNVGTSNTQQSGQHEIIEEPQGEGDYCPSDESYFSHCSSDTDDDNDDEILSCEVESYSKTYSNKAHLLGILRHS
ncbi:hypothetical protein Tco_1081473 [Tanacetum coccineum]|uniref:Uncharacterized protein n=1 Tax=Tanacetum coccineum TaxID=301880 RepID=A0ABQ5HXS9_9ASTR